MKNILFAMLCMCLSTVNAQMSIIDDYAINTNHSFLKFNRVITACSFGGNIKEANILTNNLDKNSIEFHIAKGLLLHNLKGKHVGLNYIDKEVLNKTYNNYAKSYIGLLTENIDDYYHYLELLDSNVLKAKLKVQSLIKRYSYKYVIKGKIISEIENVLANEKLTEMDTLYFSLALVDFKNWRNNNEKYAYLLKTYKRFSSYIDHNLCLKYLRLCNGESCNNMKDVLLAEEYIYDSIDNEFVNTPNEEKLIKIIERSNSFREKLDVKSYVFLHQSKLPRDTQLLLGIKTDYKFSDSFINYLKKGFNRSNIITNILNEKEILIDAGLNVNKDTLNKLKDDEIFSFLGVIKHIQLLKYHYDKKIEDGKIAIKARYSDFRTWKTYLTFLENNPLHKETTVIDVTNSKEYDEVLEKLSSFHPNNFYQKKLFLYTLVDNKRFFQLNNRTAKIVINNIIDILVLSQDECNPEHSDTKNNDLYYYFDSNRALVRKIHNTYSSYSNDACLRYLLSTMSRTEAKEIVDSLEVKMNTHSNNQNLKEVFRLLTLIYNENKVFGTYSPEQENQDISKNNEKETTQLLLTPIKNIKELDDVPFSIITEVPIFPGCENEVTSAGKKKCFNTMMRQHVINNFNAELALCVKKNKVLNKKTNEYEDQCVSLIPGKKRIYLSFKIGKTGLIEDITARAPHPVMKEEAIRLAKLLPKMTPGKSGKKIVRVGYTIPITFNVE
ncbi:energy transducer TonB [Tenacibaculum xiamenense]|uniref:energy transducer TonB n=1 Tax=Tenacibaculum xiamenense TaxID=1261553 RepID=UPI0038940FF9